MFKKVFLLGIIFVSLIFVSGCVAPLNVSEIMQVPEGTELYTNYNIWYEIPWDISSINYQKGKIIPFGSKVKILNANMGQVTFKLASNGRQYTIIYHEQWGMQPINGFMKQLFSSKTRLEQTDGISDAIQRKMLRGEVVRGMTRNEVEKTYGPPSPHRTPLKEGLTWIYWDNRFVSKRIIFRKNKVIAILK